MGGIRDILHDELDVLEENREKAQAVVAKARDAIGEISSGSVDFHEVLTRIALTVEDGLTDLTTEQVRRSVEFARRKARR